MRASEVAIVAPNGAEGAASTTTPTRRCDEGNHDATCHVQFQYSDNDDDGERMHDGETQSQQRQNTGPSQSVYQLDDVSLADGASMPVPVRGNDVEEHLDEDTPSSRFEKLICDELESLIDRCMLNWATSLRRRSVWRQRVCVIETIPVFFIATMLLVSCILFPTSQNIVCLFLSILIFAFNEVAKGFLLWAQLTETKYRTASVMRQVIARWKRRIQEMHKTRSQNAAERRLMFLQSFTFVPAKAFRMLAVVHHHTYRLKYVHKSLMVKGCKRLDEGTLQLRWYNEPHGLCKLADVMKIILESSAIVLKPLTDKAKPPRLPNLLISKKKFVEEEITTDESDGEHDKRTVVGGGNSISVYQHMEYFIQRVFLIAWAAAMLLTVGAGVFYYYVVKAPLWEGVFLFPSVALLGLLPVNAVVTNRILVLYANVYLEKLFHFIVAKRVHSINDKLPHFSFWSTLQTAYQIIRRQQPPGGARNPLVFGNSLVDTFGMATVIAVLDQSGIVTDMVQLPVRMLMLRRNPRHHHSSSDDDEDNITGWLNERSKNDARERQRELKKQIKRKKFQEQRFVTLKLAQSSRADRAVEFADPKDLKQHISYLNPMCLCILMHVNLEEPQELHTWMEPFRFSDCSKRWARALYWVPRTCRFDGSVVNAFRVIARVFQIHTKKHSGYRNSSIEQASSVLAEDATGVLHVFTMGTPYMVADYCTAHWTGDDVDDFDQEEKKEVVHMAKQQWEEGNGMEAVALSHRVLPERYRKYVDQLSLGDRNRAYREFFFRDGEEVNEANYEQKEQEHRMQVLGMEARPTRKGANASGDASNSANRSSGFSCGDAADDVNDDDAPRPCYSCPTSPVNFTKYRRHGSAFPRRASMGDIPTDSPGQFEKDDCLTPSTFVHLLATTSHSFLGLVGLRDSIRPNVQETMSTLEDAGVRCMFFCSENEKHTKSFGARVGLETDWNCCISLKEGAVSLDPFSIRAQLPFGIKSIRKHILHVDPIPLQVNLFSHSQGVSKRAMLSILQDNHEVVIAVGSVFNHSNVRSFVQADLSVGVLPTRRGPNADKEQNLPPHVRIVEPSDFTAVNSINHDIPLYRNVAELIGCSCTLRAPPTTSMLPILATMVRQGRLRLSGIGNCVEFVLHASMMLVVLNVVSLVIGAPLLLSPTATVCVLHFVIPLLALSCTYTAYAGMDPMKTMTSRHNHFVRLAIFRHSSTVWMLRYLPSIATLLVLGITASVHLCHTSMLRLIERENEECMSASQGYVALTLSYWLIVHSWTHISRHHAIGLNFSLRLSHGKRSSYLFQSFRWLGTNVVVVVFTIALVLIDTSPHLLGRTFFPSPVHFVASFVFPIVLLALDVPIKRWRERRFTNMQKFRKLSFGTRLGMHSPRGDYEPEGITYAGGSGQPNASAFAPGGETVDATGGNTAKISLWKRLSEAFYRFASLRQGRMELNCVCCDHLGGNYASYHVAAAAL